MNIQRLKYNFYRRNNGPERFYNLYSQLLKRKTAMWFPAYRRVIPLLVKNYIGDKNPILNVKGYLVLYKKRQTDLSMLIAYLMHIATENLILFLHSLYKPFWSNYTCFLLLRIYLHKKITQK